MIPDYKMPPRRHCNIARKPVGVSSNPVLAAFMLRGAVPSLFRPLYGVDVISGMGHIGSKPIETGSPDRAHTRSNDRDTRTNRISSLRTFQTRSSSSIRAGRAEERVLISERSYGRAARSHLAEITKDSHSQPLPSICAQWRPRYPHHRFAGRRRPPAVVAQAILVLIGVSPHGRDGSDP